MCNLRKLCLLWVGFALPLCAQTTTTKRSISLAECVELAIKYNLELKIERYNPLIAKDTLDASSAIYEPTLAFSGGSGYNATPPSYYPDYGVVSPVSRVYRDSIEADLGGYGPYGSTYTISLPFERRYGPSFMANGSGYDYYTGSILLQGEMPLLKNFAIDQPRWVILLNRERLKRTELGVQTTLISMLSSVRSAYYSLIAARENVKVQEKALELATRLYEDNRAKVRAGALPPLDEKQAESQVAVTRADLISAQQTVNNAQNVLKGLFAGNVTEWRTIELVPVEQLLAIAQVLDVQESWQRGLVQRPDLGMLRNDVAQADLNIRFYKNQMMPSLSVVGRYGQSAVEGDGGSVFLNTFTPEYQGYYGGMKFSYPLGNQRAKSNYRLSKDERSQAELFVTKLERDIMVQIDNAIHLAQSSYDRTKATRQAREYAELALDAEQKKFSNGKSTSYTVLLFQRDVTNARSNEIQALADYNKALVAVDQAEGSTLAKLKISLDTK